MIGHVTITRPDDTAPGTDGTATATLAEDGTWSVTGNPYVADYLLSVVTGLDDDYRGPSEGPYGVRLLTALHGIVSGVIYLEPKPKQAAGTIY